MVLSQDRTRTVLQHVLSLLEAGVIGSGCAQLCSGWLPSSRRVIDSDTQQENSASSRRVNFRVITNSELQIRNIIERLDGNQGLIFPSCGAR